MVSVRSLKKVGAGLSAFVPAARVLASPDTLFVPAPVAPVDGAAQRVEKHLGGNVVRVTNGEVRVETYDGIYTLHVSAGSRVWKGGWGPGATLAPGDRIEAWGTRQAGDIFEVEKMWINIVNLLGPVTSVRDTDDGYSLTHQDRFRGALTVQLGPGCMVVAGDKAQPFNKVEHVVRRGDRLQIIGVRQGDKVQATRLFWLGPHA